MSGDDDDGDGRDGTALRDWFAAARPELDQVCLAVMRARVTGVLFGRGAPVRIGRYELVREVGTGGGGAVFVARDPELDREIAIKLIAASDPARRARAMAEGQALARLAHPNIVPVFDVGIAGERVYLAMELVRGESLREYAAHAVLRDVVRAYRQAADGLVAAHAAGFVHRDFKPDNAVIGHDGRVRVVDFGLAAGERDDVIGGTPRYMAPEQCADGRDRETTAPAATAAADQYAFGVSLREAAAQTGADPVPRWLAAIVRRTTSAAPDARYPSMAAVLEALADDPRARWKRRGLIAAPVVVAGAVALAFAVGRRGEPALPSCDAGATAIASAWTPARTAAVRDHIAGLATPFATASAPRIGAQLDGYAQAWIEAHRAACLAARAEPSALITSRRTACLARARNRLGTAIDVLAATDDGQLPGALAAVSELPALGACGDPVALVDDVPPPPPGLVVRVAELRAALDRSSVHVDAGLADAADEAARLVADARALGYGPVLARALLAQGHALDAVGHSDQGVAALTEAVDLAIPLRDDATAVEAYARLVRAVGATDDDGDDVQILAGVRPILGLAGRLGASDQFAVALLYNNIGVARMGDGQPDLARAEWRRALPIARRLVGPGRVELAWVRTNLAMVLPPGAERDGLLDEAVALTSNQLGADHPLALRIAIAAAFYRDSIDGARAALGPPCARLAALHSTQRGSILECSYELGVLDAGAGDHRLAAAAFARAAAVAPGDSVSQQELAIAAAFVDVLAGRAAPAQAALDRLAATLPVSADTAWFELRFPADVELARAMLHRAANDLRGEASALDRAIAVLDRAASIDSLVIARRLTAARAMRARLASVTGGRSP